MSKKSPKKTHAVRGGTAQANRLAIAILEVLAGLRTPTEAADALGISVPRYYQLETRALDALVLACEPKPKGKRPSLEGKIATLERELQRAQHECARQQAMVRLAQRSVGLKAKPTPAANTKTKRKKKRRPSVRALKAARALQKAAPQEEAETLQQPARETASTGDKATPAKETPAKET